MHLSEWEIMSRFCSLSIFTKGRASAKNGISALLHGCLICVSALAAVGCARLSFISHPSPALEIEGATHEADILKIGDVAKALGFERADPSRGPGEYLGPREEYSDENERALERWRWMYHMNPGNSVSLWVSQGMVTHNLYVRFADDENRLAEHLSNSCRKYLEFVPAIKGAFSSDPVGFVFWDKGCGNPDGK